MRTSKYGESNASALEDPTLTVGNPLKEVLIMNLPDHRYRHGEISSTCFKSLLQLSYSRPSLRNRDAKDKDC
ncbi:hypothetical protein Tco_1467405 [Tanacetum coccineum]